MLSRIIQWSGKNPFLVLLATLFVVIGGVVAVMKTPLDALPDLSDVQVIVYTEYPGQAPQVVEDQVTYPLTTAMLAVPKSKVVRAHPPNTITHSRTPLTCARRPVSRSITTSRSLLRRRWRLRPAPTCRPSVPICWMPRPPPRSAPCVTP